MTPDAGKSKNNMSTPQWVDIINGKEIKLTQFADDTTLILDGTSSLQATLNTLEIFGTLSGLRMNTEKTQIVWIGKKKHCKDKLNVTKGLVWGKDTFNLLGINFSVDLDLVINLNYDPILDDITKSLNVWKKRFLTPLGEITVITRPLPRYVSPAEYRRGRNTTLKFFPFA